MKLRMPNQRRKPGTGFSENWAARTMRILDIRLIHEREVG